MNWTKEEYNRLLISVDFLIDYGMTFENRVEAYEHYGYVISILKGKGYPKYGELYHTFTKEVEYARAVKSREEFDKPIVSAYLQLVPNEIIRVKEWMELSFLPK